jgi:hypothetical protein
MLMLNSITAKGQISIIQDSKGETSFENLVSTVNLNFSAEEITGKVFRTLRNFEEKGSLIGGLGLSLGAVKGKTILFNKGELNSKGSIDFFLGGNISKGDVDWYPIASFKYTKKSVNLWDSTDISVASVPIENTEFQIGVTKTTGKYPIVSFAVKFGTTDNSFDLLPGTVSTSFNKAGNLLQLNSKTAVGPGDQLRKNIKDAKILFDLLWIKGRVGIPLSFRLNFPGKEGQNDYLSIGTGLFINKATDKSNQFVGGIMIQDPDLLRANIKQDILKRLTVALVVGIPFGD